MCSKPVTRQLMLCYDLSKSSLVKFCGKLDAGRSISKVQSVSVLDIPRHVCVVTMYLD